MLLLCKLRQQLRPYYCTRLLAAAARVFTIVLAAVASNVNKNHVTAIGQKNIKALLAAALKWETLERLPCLAGSGIYMNFWFFVIVEKQLA